MPIAQITIHINALSGSSLPAVAPAPVYILNNYTAANASLVPFTAYPQVNLSGRYKCRLLGVNWCDTLGATTTATNNAIVTVDSSTWSFPGSAQRGYTFSNKTDHIQLTGPDTPYWEIRNTGALMDITLSAQQSVNTATWTTLGFQFIILTLDLEKVSEMA